MTRTDSTKIGVARVDEIQLRADISGAVVTQVSHTMAFVLVDANDVQVERQAVGDDGVGSDALIEVPGEWETAPNHGNPVRKVHLRESRKKGLHL